MLFGAMSWVGGPLPNRKYYLYSRSSGQWDEGRVRVTQKITAAAVSFWNEFHKDRRNYNIVKFLDRATKNSQCCDFLPTKHIFPVVITTM